MNPALMRALVDEAVDIWLTWAVCTAYVARAPFDAYWG